MANNSRFRFCGEVVIPGSNNKIPFIKRDVVNFSNGSVDKISINFGVKDGGNCCYVGLQGFKHSTIKTRDKDNNNIEIDWGNRFDEDVVSNVSRLNKFIVNLGERKEFITEWDMIEYLEEVLPEFKEDVVVRGRFARRPGSGESKNKFFDNFNIDSVLAASVVEDKNRGFKITGDLYYNKDSLDLSMLKTEGIVMLDAYTPMWITTSKKEEMVPFTVVFDPSKIQTANNNIGFDITTDIGKKQIQYYVDKQLGRKSKKYVKMRWSVGVVNGSEEVKFDESCLTPIQKEEIELGLSTIEDFMPEGKIFGKSIREFRLIKNAMRNGSEYEYGPVEMYDESEFQDLIYHPAEDEKLSDVMKEVEKGLDDDDMDDLFN